MSYPSSKPGKYPAFGVRRSSILVWVNHCTAVAARCGNNFGDNLAVIVHNLVAAVIGYCCIRGNDFAVAIRSTVAIRSVVTTPSSNDGAVVDPNQNAAAPYTEKLDTFQAYWMDMT